MQVFKSACLDFAGLGYCLTFLPTVTILSQYFARRRSLVTALASTGESLSMFALAPGERALERPDIKDIAVTLGVKIHAYIVQTLITSL